MAIAFEMVTSAERPLPNRTFVGREPELKQLRVAFNAAASGDGCLVTVAGEPGIGKTALCEQLARYVQQRGGRRTLLGHCYEEGSLSLPYLAFIEALRGYVLEREIDALREELSAGAPFVARILPDLRERLQVELSPASEPEENRWRLLQSVADFLRNVASASPLVLILEDLHGADRGTLDLVQHVARNLVDCLCFSW